MPSTETQPRNNAGKFGAINVPPTPEEIAARIKEIRDGWNATEEQSRAGFYRRKPVELSVGDWFGSEDGDGESII